jgi:hypothetical protein
LIASVITRNEWGWTYRRPFVENDGIFESRIESGIFFDTQRIYFGVSPGETSMNNICRISLNRALVASALVALLVLPCATPSYAAETQQTATVGSEEHETPQETIIGKRIAEGFAVIGPLELMGASASELMIGAAPGNPEVKVSLKNKRVSVMDEHGNSLTVSSVKKGANVIICQKKDQVIIYVVPSTKKESSNAK